MEEIVPHQHRKVQEEALPMMPEHEMWMPMMPEQVLVPERGGFLRVFLQEGTEMLLSSLLNVTSVPK